MIGFVIVSHHPDLAAGVKALADQMVQHQVPIAVAAGIDDPDNPIGTDAMRIMEAITTVYTDEGVVIFMDLGSALLSTDMALDFLDEEQRAHIYLSDAPLVEGALAAVTQAAAGAGIEDVLAEAAGALKQKKVQLGQETEPRKAVPREEAPDDLGISEQALTLAVEIQNPMGLHARPAAAFVREVNRFTSRVVMQNISGHKSPVNAKSMNNVMLQELRRGDQLCLWFEGEDAEAAQRAVAALARQGFGEPDAVPVTKEQKAGPAVRPTDDNGPDKDICTGQTLVAGLAVGKAHIWHPMDLLSQKWAEAEVEAGGDEQATALRHAIEKVQTDLARKVERVRALAPAEAEIFRAHMLLLTDAELEKKVSAGIQQGVPAALAWQREILRLEQAYASLQDPLLRSRAQDVHDVGNQVLAVLLDRTEDVSLLLAEPCIVLARDLQPSEVEQLDPSQVLGVALAGGNSTSHAAILLKSAGIPTVIGLGDAALFQGQSEEEVILDADQGRLVRHPLIQERDAIRNQQRQRQQQQTVALANCQQAARSPEGSVFQVLANIRGAVDLPLALEQGAEGVGLFRTEYLFLGKVQAPDLQTQTEEYSRVLRLLAKGLPLTIRTMDIGGDKHVGYLQQEQEANPFLGWRGLRYHLAHPDLFALQLQAICQAAADTNHPVKVMLPMVTSLEEIEQAKQLLFRVRQESALQEKLVQVGIMVEVPAAALLLERLLPSIDFVSIGTNDLTQYTLAADRGNSQVQNLVNPLHPAVVLLIQRVIAAAHTLGKEVSMCGEMAGDLKALPLLAGLGLRSFSMTGRQIPLFKEAVRGLNMDSARQIAEQALHACDTAEVSSLLA